MLLLISASLTGNQGSSIKQHEAEDEEIISNFSHRIEAGVSSLMRRKRSLGLFASMFNRMMFNEVQDSMEQDTNVVGEEAEDVVKLVKCDLVLERKVCTIKPSEKVCQNYYGKLCFMYKYPKTTTSVEKRQ